MYNTHLLLYTLIYKGIYRRTPGIITSCSTSFVNTCDCGKVARGGVQVLIPVLILCIYVLGTG